MTRAWISALIAMIVVTPAADSAPTRRVVADTAAELLEGRGDGVAITDDGRLLGVPGWRSTATLDEPVIMAGELDADGSLIVGTGHPARLYRIKGRAVELLAEVPGEQATAVLPTADGVLVATVTPGVLHRFDRGRLEEVGRLGDGGIWDLAVFDGAVIAAAGSPAALYRLGPKGFSRWLELPDIHARCLEVVDGKLLIGTSGEGLILAVDVDGRMAMLVDSPFTEISDMVAADDGSVWAVALVGEPAAPAAASSAANGSGGGDATTEGTTTQTGSLNLELPKINGATATSEVVRLTPEGALLSVHRFTRQVASAVARDGDGVLVGTGFEGEVWRFMSDGGARLASVDAVQVVDIVGDGEILLAQGPASVLVRRSKRGENGRYRSAAQRLPRPARFGEYRIEPEVDGVRIRFRTGASEKPDRSWLPWTEWSAAATGRVPLPPARSLQWELELPVGGAVERVEVAMAEVNLPPRVSGVTVEDPGVVYLAGPPPSGPVIDIDNPDVSGIFTVLDTNDERQATTTKGKKYYRLGYRTVSWKGEDPNEDPLRFRLEIELRDGRRLSVREDVEGNQLGVDTTALPDGVVRFVVTASDGPSNPGAALESTSVSRWFTVDNTPPEVELEPDGDRWTVRVRDASSPIARVEWSRSGAPWQPLAPADGVLDGASESFTFPRERDDGLIVVRAADRQHNRTTTGATEER